MEVLDDKHRRRRSCEVAQQCRGYRVSAGALGNQIGQFAAEACGYVKQWSKRLRREERIARSPDGSHVAADGLAEAAQEGRLPRTGFTADEQHASAMPGPNVLQRAAELRKLIRPL
jgi:hypothetical protein